MDVPYSINYYGYSCVTLTLNSLKRTCSGKGSSKPAILKQQFLNFHFQFSSVIISVEFGNGKIVCIRCTEENIAAIGVDRGICLSHM